jgi:hypothetical protein
LFIDPQALDLGELWETPAHTFPLTIHNQGSIARTVERFETTCGCLQLEPRGKSIAPGDKAEFVGKLDLMPGFSQVGAGPVGVGGAPRPGIRRRSYADARMGVARRGSQPP